MKYPGMVHPLTSLVLPPWFSLAVCASTAAAAAHRRAGSVTLWAVRGWPDRQTRQRVLANLGLLVWLTVSAACAGMPAKQATTVEPEVCGPPGPLDRVGCYWQIGAGAADKGDLARAEWLYQAAIKEIETRSGPGDRELLLARSRTLLAEAYVRQGKFDAAEPLIHAAIPVLEKKRGAGSASVGMNLDNLAKIYLARREYTRAESAARRALTILEKAGSADAAVSLSILGAVSRERGKYAEAGTHLERALAIQEKRTGPDHPKLIHYMTELGRVYTLQQRYGEAEAVYRRALAIAEKAGGGTHPDAARIRERVEWLASDRRIWLTYFDPGLRAADEGDYPRAEQLLVAARGELEGLRAGEDPLRVFWHVFLADVYAAQRKHAQAHPHIRETLPILEKMGFGDDPSSAVHLYLLASHGTENQVAAHGLSATAVALRSRGDFGEAARLFEGALERAERAASGLDDLRVALWRVALAGIYRRRDRWTEAGRLLEMANPVIEKGLGPRHPGRVGVLALLADLYQAQGRYAEAEAFRGQVVAVVSATLGSEHRAVAKSLEDHAAILRVLGLAEEAETAESRARAIRERGKR